MADAVIDATGRREYAYCAGVHDWKVLAVLLIPGVEVTDRETLLVEKNSLVRFKQAAHNVQLSYVPAVWCRERD